VEAVWALMAFVGKATIATVNNRGRKIEITFLKTITSSQFNHRKLALTICFLTFCTSFDLGALDRFSHSERDKDKGYASWVFTGFNQS
jgi:hypothetical protein